MNSPLRQTGHLVRLPKTQRVPVVSRSALTIDNLLYCLLQQRSKHLFVDIPQYGRLPSGFETLLPPNRMYADKYR